MRPTEHRKCNRPVSDGDQCKCWRREETRRSQRQGMLAWWKRRKAQAEASK